MYSLEFNSNTYFSICIYTKYIGILVLNKSFPMASENNRKSKKNRNIYIFLIQKLNI